MNKATTHPSAWPVEVPGYVPVTNNGRDDEPDAVLHARLSEKLGIPASVFITLRGVAKYSASTTYAESAYAPQVRAWTDGIALMAKLLQLLSDDTAEGWDGAF